MKIREIIQCLEEVAPPSLQESYDNAGLIVGNQNDMVEKVLLTLDCTEEVVIEAIENNCGLIVAHHPIVFKGLKKINGKNYVERVIIKAIQNNIAIYAVHTNLDSVITGVNAKIAQKLGLLHCQTLAPHTQVLKKLETYIPKAHTNAVANALFAAGAGKIANYDECSFQVEGTGTFRANENANPFVGNRHERHAEAEVKLEVVYQNFKEKKILQALFEQHPYENVAYYCSTLTNHSPEFGSGMLGYLPQAMDEKEGLHYIKQNLHAKVIRHTRFLGKKIHKIAFCGGSGSFLLPQAIGCDADLYLSADFKYHEFFDAEDRIVIADIGHFETEQFTSELLLEIITKKFPNFAVRLSEIHTNPINYFI